MSINNHFGFIGHVGDTPKVHTYPDREKPNEEKRFVTVSLATNDYYRDKEGKTQVMTTWHEVVFFKPALVKLVTDYVDTGSHIAVTGKIGKAVWDSKNRTDENGVPLKDSRVRFIVNEIRLLDKPEEGGNDSGGFGNYDDDIPF
jgi:single-strand DNA-binding protein